MIRLPLPGADLYALSGWPLDQDTHAYLIRVHRLNEGDGVVIFDGAGLEIDATLRQVDGQWCLMPEGTVREGLRGHPLTLVYALPKGEKLDLVVRQATELGVGRIVLLNSQRSVVKLNQKRAEKKRGRLEKIIAEAARQSGRSDGLELLGPVDLDEALELTASANCRLILHPQGGKTFDDLPIKLPAALFVGAEGGFTDSELTKMTESGCTTITMNCPVLRTETAATVACALALHRMSAL
jgi:16S rRNA (uracil1498-N3)-methyltransferase